jgi:hypothetical protein
MKISQKHCLNVNKYRILRFFSNKIHKIPWVIFMIWYNSFSSWIHLSFIGWEEKQSSHAPNVLSITSWQALNSLSLLALKRAVLVRMVHSTSVKLGVRSKWELQLHRKACRATLCWPIDKCTWLRSLDSVSHGKLPAAESSNQSQNQYRTLERNLRNLKNFKKWKVEKFWKNKKSKNLKK